MSVQNDCEYRLLSKPDTIYKRVQYVYTNMSKVHLTLVKTTMDKTIHKYSVANMDVCGFHNILKR